MVFCKFCGKEIPEGSVCDCADSQAANSTSSAEPVSSEPTATTGNSGSNKVNIVIIAALIVVLLIILGIVSSIAGGSYKKPVKNFAKALNKCDGELLAETMLTDDMMDDADKDDLDDLDDLLESLTEYAEDEYGKNIKFTIDINDKSKLDKDDIEDIEDEYSDSYDDDVKISKGYEIDATLTIKGKDDKDEEDITLTVVKIKGDGWKISPDALGELY